MELRTLRYFLAVAQEKNITRAAENLHVTQPTLSRQISDLEEELGATLFIRGKRSLELTEDGALSLHASPDLRFVPLAPERTTRSVLIWKKNQVFNTATSLFIQSLQLLRDDAAPEELYRAARPPK